METVAQIFTLLANLPEWAWMAIGLTMLVAVVWFIIDFVSFLLVSAAMLVVGIVTISFGMDLLKALF